MVLIFQLIEELEEQIAEMRTQEANQQQRELRKIRMTYEILARNELNSKLAEINSFLEDRAAAQAENDRRKELVMDEIQKDLGERLQKSRDELSEIKKHMIGNQASVLTFICHEPSNPGFNLAFQYRNVAQLKHLSVQYDFHFRIIKVQVHY